MTLNDTPITRDACNLAIRNGVSANQITMYSQFQNAAKAKEICRVDKDGRVFRDGIDITDNDGALAQCFIEQLKLIHNIEVKRGNCID